MESNNLQAEANKGTRQIVVAPIGFDEETVEKLDKIFERERPNQRSYTTIYPYAGELVDILFVNYDEPDALVEKTEVLKIHPDIQLVAATNAPILNDPPKYHVHPYQVHGLLLTARLLSVFDKVPERSQDGLITAISVAAEPEVKEPEINSQFRVLVVDDSPAVQKSIEINLRTLKQITEIDFAESGEQALEKTAAKHYDIVFLDVMMPGIDGYETCTQLRKRPEYKHTPVVMVSAKTSPLDEVKGIIAGCTTYLTKPVKDDAFQKLSQRMLVWMAGRKA